MTRRVVAQTRVELVLALRQGERMLVTAAVPLGVLVFFSLVDVLPHDEPRGVDHLLPATLALAVMSTAMVSQGIATGFERQGGVLKRLGATPLGRTGLLAAKTLSVLAIEVVQTLVLVGSAIALGWRPAGQPATVAGLLLLGTAAFSGIGFLLAGTIRAEANIAAANGLFLVLLLLGGISFPVNRLPGPMQAVAHALPADPLVAALRGALSGSNGGRPIFVLAVWAVCATAAAAAAFRWDQS